MRAPSLELIEAGVISVEEGVRRLEALAGAADPPEPAPAPAPSVDRPVWVRWVWQAVFWTGVALLAAGGLLVSGVYAWGIAARWLNVVQVNEGEGREQVQVYGDRPAARPGRRTTRFIDRACARGEEAVPPRPGDRSVLW
jgi:hypothetical protein